MSKAKPITFGAAKTSSLETPTLSKATLMALSVITMPSAANSTKFGVQPMESKAQPTTYKATKTQSAAIPTTSTEAETL